MKSAKSIIEKDINNFYYLFTPNGADGGLHVIIGKIKLAMQLGLIDNDEMGDLIDRAFAEHAKTKK